MKPRKRTPHQLPGNPNVVYLHEFSNSAARKNYVRDFPDEPELSEMHLNGLQCGGCTYYGEFNSDYGLCCNSESRHYTESVFEHFTCPAYVHGEWDNHSFRGKVR